MTFKYAQNRATAGHEDMPYETTIGHIDLTQLNEWDEQRAVFPRRKHRGGGNFGPDPAVANAAGHGEHLFVSICPSLGCMQMMTRV
jgi:hypothetical protein